MWREHALETARVLNEINPDFIRVRTLTVTNRMPLHDEIEKGTFIRATDEEIIEEEVPPAPEETPEKLCESCGKALSWIQKYERWYCYNCKEILIRRLGYQILANRVKDHRCPDCGVTVDGVGLG